MTHPDARRWNRRYEDEGPRRVNNPPNRRLAAARPHLPRRGLALDAACGLGVNCRYLASLGLRVIGLDISFVALQMGRQAARERGLHFAAAVVDLEKLWLPAEHFDLIINFRYLQRSLFPLYQRALKPGGLLVFETFLTTGAADEPGSPAHYLQPGELLRAFSGCEVLQHGIQPTHDRTLEHLVARKPG